MTAAPDPSSLAPLRAKLREIKEEAELIAASLNAIRAGREPPIVASVQTLESRAEGLLGEQMRLYVKIQSIERATSEPPPSVPLPAASRPVGDSAPKKAKVVQSTLVGFVLLHRKDDPLQGPKVIEITSPACSGCGKPFKSLEGANEHMRCCSLALEAKAP